MVSDQHRTMNKRNRVAARLTRGWQPGRRGGRGKGSTTDDQPKRPRGRPKGATNLLTRELKEAILGGAADCGEDGKGTGGLRGYPRLRQFVQLAFLAIRCSLPAGQWG